MSERCTALKAGGWLDFYGLESPKCPHCGDTFDIQEREAWHVYEEGEHEVACHNPMCGLTFTVEVRATYTFSTNEQPDEEDEELGNG